MKRISKWNWLVVLTAIAIISIFSTGDAQAWGPLAQSAIAQAAQDADGLAQQSRGMPLAAYSPNFVSGTTMPKIFEYTDHSYANLSYDFTDIMGDNVVGIAEYCQLLAWGASQTAEKTGDNLFLQQISENTFERWINELFCDAMLTSIDSPFYGLGLAEVSVMPLLVRDTTADYTDIFGGDKISGMEVILAANFQAHVLVGELAVLDSEIFKENARKAINRNDWLVAMEESVNSVEEYVINSTQPQTGVSWLGSDTSNYGAQLLGNLGILLRATNDASIVHTMDLGVYRYHASLRTDRVNYITLNYLFNVAHDLGEPVMMRQMARTLYDLMVEREFGFSYAGEKPSIGPAVNPFGPQHWIDE